MTYSTIACGQDATGPKTVVLVDAAHSHTWLGQIPDANLYEYHALHGPARAIQALEKMGWEARLQLFAPWTDQDLKDCHGIFLNLVSVDQPPFLVEEILRIRRFIEQGGGLCILTDHTNCYFHGHMLTPLLAELDIEMPQLTACDVPPATMGSGNAWIAVRDFQPHPITRGLSAIGVLSGGCVDPRFAVAWTSPQGWGDLGRSPRYAQTTDIGLFGDFRKTSEDVHGKQGVLLAKEFGRGRIAILADQNAVGGVFLNYADNRLLWHQIMAWVCQRPVEEAARQALIPEADKTQIWCYEDLTNAKYQWGCGDDGQLYHLFCWLGRFYDARATDRWLPNASVLILPNAHCIRQANVLGQVQAFAKRGRTILLLPGEGESLAEIKQTWSQLIAKENVAPEAAGSQAIAAQWALVPGGQCAVLSDSQPLRSPAFAAPDRRPDPQQQAIESWLIQWLVRQF